MSSLWRTFLCLIALIGIGVLAFANQRGIVHLAGIDTQQSDNYDFVSGVGPMLITAVGYTGMIIGLWHHVNCHAIGCLRIGRHKVDGTPWCNRHHLDARRTAIASLNDVVAKLDELMAASMSKLDELSTSSSRATDAILSSIRQQNVESE